MSDFNYLDDCKDGFDTYLRRYKKVRIVMDGQDCLQDNIEKEKLAFIDDNFVIGDKASFWRNGCLYPLVLRTVTGHVGLVMRTPPNYSFETKSLEILEEYASPDGRPMKAIQQEMLREVISVGRYGVLCDYAMDGRTPRLVPYKAESIMNWRYMQGEGNKRILSYLLLEDDCYEDGYEARLEAYIDELGYYAAKRYLRTKAGAGQKPGEWYLSEELTPTAGANRIPFIPFVFINAHDLRGEIGPIPMLDLANLNIAHFKNSCDYERNLFISANATPVFAGNISDGDKPRSLGPGSMITLPENGKAMMLETSGSSLAAQRQAMQDKEMQMAALGARLITEDKARNESEQTARMRTRGQMATLTDIVESCEMGTNKAFSYLAFMEGEQDKENKVELNRDFIESRMSPSELQQLTHALAMGKISYETYWWNLQRGEIAPIDRSAEDEQGMLDSIEQPENAFEGEQS